MRKEGLISREAEVWDAGLGRWGMLSRAVLDTIRQRHERRAERVMRTIHCDGYSLKPGEESWIQAGDRKYRLRIDRSTDTNWIVLERISRRLSERGTDYREGITEIVRVSSVGNEMCFSEVQGNPIDPASEYSLLDDDRIAPMHEERLRSFTRQLMVDFRNPRVHQPVDSLTY